MKHCVPIIFMLNIMLCFSCMTPVDPGFVIQRIENEINQGNFQKANHLADSMKIAFANDSVLIDRIDSLKEMTSRIALDFSVSEAEINKKLKIMFGDYTAEDRQKWEEQNWLEWRMINGEKRYFDRAASNLRLILEHQKKLVVPQVVFNPDETDLFRIKHASEVIALTKLPGAPVKPVRFKIKYSLTVEPDVVPPGEVIRCWLPYPREVHARQKEIHLISTFPAEHFIAPDTVGQRTLYFEQKAVKGEPARFQMELSYCSFAQYFDLPGFKIKPYLTNAPLYTRFTSEEKPHIVFSDKIRNLSDSIVREKTNPVEIVRQIFYWIDKNIPWARALEYSIMPDIPEYVIQNRHGDCGMQTLLFITLARYNGIPAKWQSGWMLPPGDINLHDWCEVYFEGVGWVPLDMSYGRLPSGNMKVRDYYMSGIDAYRLIVNDATGSSFIPRKKYMRSEPVDFQRGEVEWRGGNLYFDKWKYSMEVEYF